MYNYYKCITNRIWYLGFCVSENGVLIRVKIQPSDKKSVNLPKKKWLIGRILTSNNHDASQDASQSFIGHPRLCLFD